MIAFIDEVEVLRGDKFVATVLHKTKRQAVPFSPRRSCSLSSHRSFSFITLP